MTTAFTAHAQAKEPMASPRLALSQVGSVAAAGKLCNLASAPEDSRFEGIYDQCTGYVTSSICCAVCSDNFGRTKAVVEMLNKKLGRFDAGDEKIAQKICAAMSMYLK